MIFRLTTINSSSQDSKKNQCDRPRPSFSCGNHVDNRGSKFKVQSAILNSTVGSIMDVDEVWTHIGEFGPSQKLIFYCLCLAQVFASLQVFIFSFIGVDPGWKCSMLSTKMDDSITVGLEDPSAKCQYYEQGECMPEYSKEFTSIVTEVNSHNYSCSVLM